MLTKVFKNDKLNSMFRIHLYVSSFSFSLFQKKKDAKMTFVSQNFPNFFVNYKLSQNNQCMEKKEKKRLLRMVLPYK